MDGGGSRRSADYPRDYPAEPPEEYREPSSSSSSHRHHFHFDHGRDPSAMDHFRNSTSHVGDSSSFRPPTINTGSGDLYRPSTSTTGHGSSEAFRPSSSGHSYHHSPGCPHTSHVGHIRSQDTFRIPPQPMASAHDPFGTFPRDMCRGLTEGLDSYTDVLHDHHHHHHDHHLHDHHHHDHLHDPYHRHPSPQDMARPPPPPLSSQAPDMYRDLPNLPHHHHHHHHLPHQHHSHHPHHLVRHTSNIDRHTLERHRANLESRGVMETRHEYEPRETLPPVHFEPMPLDRNRRQGSAPDMLRHHRSVPDMYASLQQEDAGIREQHTYGEGCRLRGQHAKDQVGGDGATTGGGSDSSVPSSRPQHGRLQRQHSLGQELSRSYSNTHDLCQSVPHDVRALHQQDLTRSRSNALDLSRAGSTGGLGVGSSATLTDIRRSRSSAQEICRGNRSGATSTDSGGSIRESQMLRHALSTHDLPRSHSPKGGMNQGLPDVYPEPPRSSSGGSSGPSPPVPPGPLGGGIGSSETFPRVHSAHCEVARAAQNNYYQTQLPPTSRVSPLLSQSQPPPQPFHHSSSTTSLHLSHQFHQQQQPHHQQQHQPLHIPRSNTSTISRTTPRNGQTKKKCVHTPVQVVQVETTFATTC
ncbi:uncharacterized protein LOC143041275 [Oratosquilla oratoria]|uniref:uncharacterized protein LOC143041275 n=1 Tax=Oratosquilla oratoria TaxID=337810 RepID=UPI003F761D9A